MAKAYTEASIKTLSSTEHIRLRPGMYIGRLGNGAHAEDGIYVLLKETIDNCIDEFTMGHGRKIEVEVTDTGNPREVNRSGGAGLRGMKERAAVYGGTLSAGPGPDGGWHVSASLNVPAAPALAAR